MFEIANGALLAAGDVYVIANAEANSEIVALANEAYAYGDTTSDGVTIYVATFNGDDVRALAYAGGGGDTVIMDIIGTLEGGDPGAGWAVSGVDDAPWYARATQMELCRAMAATGLCPRAQIPLVLNG